METLASRITREGGLPEIDAVGWAIRVAFSIEQIHALGGVHGRLSADGVLVAADKCTAEGRLLPFAELPENVAYHSPERERGEGGSQADDAWAVAVILYLALSGNLPFSGSGDDDVRRKIRTVPAPPLAVFDVGDDTLQAIVDRALARNRDARTAAVGDLRRELEQWRPEACLDALSPLLTDDEPEDEVTMIQTGLPSPLRAMIDAASAPRKPSIAPPRPTTARPAPSDEVPSGPLPALVAPSISSSPMAEDEDEATLMHKPGLKLPSLMDDESLGDRSDDPFAVPKSRAAVPRVASADTAKSTPPPASTPAPPTAVAQPVTTAEAPKTPVSTGEPPKQPAPSVPPPSSAAPPVTPAQAPAASIAPPAPAPRRSITGVLLVCVAVFILAAVAASFWTRGRAPDAPPLPGASEHPGAAPPATAPAPAPTVEATTSAAPVAPASASASASAAAAAPAGVAACVVPLFPPESFDASSDFSFVCSEADPIKGASEIRTQLVRSRRNMSDGMKEWALLGWYEMAAFAVVRARCCPGAAALKLPETPGCPAVPEVLGGITAATAVTTDPADKALKKAVDAYTTDVYCIVRSGVAARFGRVGNPQGGEDTTFMRFLGQVVAAKR